MPLVFLLYFSRGLFRYLIIFFPSTNIFHQKQGRFVSCFHGDGIIHTPDVSISSFQASILELGMNQFCHSFKL